MVFKIMHDYPSTVDAIKKTTPPRTVPCWDEYFLEIARAVSKRSKDPSTQCGCVIVDDHHRIVSTGYNGPPPGWDDAALDWSRPEKYEWIRHSEANAISFSQRIDLVGCTVYVTGHPCHKCLLEIVAKGCRKVVYMPMKIHMVDEKELAACDRIIERSGIEIIEYKIPD